MPTAAAIQGAYIPQYPPGPSSNVSVEVGAFFLCNEARTQEQAGFCPERALSLTALLILLLTGGCEECWEERLHWCSQPACSA